MRQRLTDDVHSFSNHGLKIEQSTRFSSRVQVLVNASELLQNFKIVSGILELSAYRKSYVAGIYQSSLSTFPNQRLMNTPLISHYKLMLMGTQPMAMIPLKSLFEQQTGEVWQEFWPIPAMSMGEQVMPLNYYMTSD
jgi:hypothetical protein